MKVAVTGASGYIASWVVKKLLNRGHEVHATVRDISASEKVNHLLKEGVIHNNRLKLFEADLLTGGFEQAFEGCDAVIHMASPFLIGKVKNPKKQLVDPAIEGTRRVMDAVNKSTSVKKVVVTSSVVALFCDADEAAQYPDKTFTSEHWNTRASVSYNPYSYSKTMAEKTAREMAKEQSRYRLTTIHPGFVMGPSLSGRKDGASMDFMIKILRGEFEIGAPRLYNGIVDVRDVAEAHVRAIEEEYVDDRFVVAKEVMSIYDMSQVVKHTTEHTAYPIPKRNLPAFFLYLVGPFLGFSWRFLWHNLNHKFTIDGQPVCDQMGLNYRSLEETFRDMVLQIERDNLT